MTGEAARPRILLLDTDLETRNHYITLAIHDALARLPEVGAVILAPMREAVARFRSERCDIFIAVGSARPQAPLLARLCALARRSALWTTEDPYELTANIAHGRGFDHVFSNDLGCVEAYGGRASHLPLAASRLFQDLPVPATDAEYRYDLLFIGTAWPNRVAAIDRILASFQRRLRVKIGLSGNSHLPPVRLARAGIWTGWRASNAQFARLANVSRVTLGLERRFSTADAAAAKGSTPPPRLFEVALAGGYQVFLADGDEAARYFTPGREFALCHDEARLVEDVHWALAHPEERMTRAAAARARAQREHLYDHRARDLLRVLGPPAATPSTTAAGLAGATRRVLVVTHNLLGRRPGGGVEVYQELLRRLGARFSPLFLVPETITAGGSTRSWFVVCHPGGEVDRCELPTALHDRMLHDAAAENLFQRILFEFRIDLVHYQHLLHYPLSLPIISRACGVPSLLTLHDYYLICSKLNLLDYRGVYCDPATLAMSTCDICLSATDQLPAGSQTRRRNFVRQVLGAVDLVVANTPWSLDYLGRIFPEFASAPTTVLEMCLPVPPPRALAARPLSGPLRVVIPGNFTDVKGGHHLVRLFNLMRHDGVEFTILGALTPPFPEIFAALKFTNVQVRGGYRSEEIFTLLAGQDMSLHLSIWPETYVISLSEAWAAGVVPIVSRLGALGERVCDGQDGFVIDPYDLGRAASLLRRFAENRDELRPLVATIGEKPVVTPAQHLAGLRELYDRLIAQHPVHHVPPDGGPAQGFHLSSATLGLRTNSPRWDSDENIWDEPLIAGPPDAASMAPGAEIPGKGGELPVEPARPIDFARFSLDMLAVDEAVGDAGIAVAALGGAHRLRVSGWSYRPFFGPPIKRFVRLRRDSFCRDYLATAVARPDIAVAVDDPTAEGSGFRADIGLDTLPGGIFWLDVAAQYDGHIFEYRRAARLDVVAPSALAARQARVSLDGMRIEALPAEHAGLPKLTVIHGTNGVHLSLDRFSGDGGTDTDGQALLSDGEVQAMELAGWAFCPAAGMPLDVFCRLRGPTAAQLFAMRVQRRFDVAGDAGSELACEGGFSFTLAGARLPAGVHHIDLLQVGERAIAEFRDVGRLLVQG